MLGYDVHAEHYPLLRDIVATSKQPALRRAALRLLAADSGSRALMRRIASDRTRGQGRPAPPPPSRCSPWLRRDFDRVARTVVLDDDEDDDVRATVISAITHGPTAPGRDVERKVREIDAAPGGPRQLNRAAREFTTARSTSTRPYPSRDATSRRSSPTSGPTRPAATSCSRCCTRDTRRTTAGASRPRCGPGAG